MLGSHQAVRIETINVIVMLETIQDVLSLFASTCTASRRAPATLCRSQPLCQQLHGVVSLFARGHRPVMAVINAGRAWKANSARGSRWTPPSDVSLQRCIHGPRYVVQGILWQAHVRHAHTTEEEEEEDSMCEGGSRHACSGELRLRHCGY